MIIGIGTDIVDCKRIEESINKNGDRFLNRCFSEFEIAQAEKLVKNKISLAEILAKRWAAKEACAKAMGSGIRDGIFLKDIETRHDDNGKPILKLYNGALKQLNNLKEDGKEIRIDVSISDEPPMALAFVVISCF